MRCIQAEITLIGLSGFLVPPLGETLYADETINRIPSTSEMAISDAPERIGYQTMNDRFRAAFVKCLMTEMGASWPQAD
jgi:hypothetical protein